MANSEQHIMKNALPTNRLEALSDAVFAIVMTLLVLGLGVPVFKESSMHQQFTQLLEMWPKFASYFATFLILGLIWSLQHYSFSLIKRIDSVFIWLHIIALMFIALLPFSTSLLGEYWGQQLPVLIYEGNCFMCLLIATVAWLYATGKYRLVDPDIDPHEVRMGKIGPLIALAVIAIAMGVSFLNTVASMIIMLVCVLSSLILRAAQTRIRVAEQVAK
jgi:uncharacterized membrane protein